MYLAVHGNILDARMGMPFVTRNLLQASISWCRRDHTAEFAVASAWNVTGQREL
jgi:hypothetical protein